MGTEPPSIVISQSINFLFLEEWHRYSNYIRIQNIQKLPQVEQKIYAKMTENK